MTVAAPVKFLWTADGIMAPVKGYLARAETQFEVGKVYQLEVREERSSQEHNHYFATLADAHANLSERATEKLKTPDHLRKWALIETNWYDEVVTDCGTHEVALRMATFTRRMDDYCEVRLRAAEDGGEKKLLVVRSAKSQSMKSMDKESFRKSKQDVLDLLSDMIGVNRLVLERYGRQGAAS